MGSKPHADNGDEQADENEMEKLKALEAHIDDLGELYSGETVEAFSHTMLIEAGYVAVLAYKGYIEAAELPRIHRLIGDERAVLVSEAYESLEGMYVE